MPKEQFSFDIVSEVDMQEVANAVDQTRRELAQRFDFKGTDTEIHQDNTTIDLRSCWNTCGRRVCWPAPSRRGWCAS